MHQSTLQHHQYLRPLRFSAMSYTGIWDNWSFEEGAGGRPRHGSAATTAPTTALASAVTTAAPMASTPAPATGYHAPDDGTGLGIFDDTNQGAASSSWIELPQPSVLATTPASSMLAPTQQASGLPVCDLGRARPLAGAGRLPSHATWEWKLQLMGALAIARQIDLNELD